jgi:hypothetical protein
MGRTIEDWRTSDPFRESADQPKGLCIPAGRYWTALSNLRFVLGRNARWHARRAVTGFVSDDADEQLQAASSAGSAIELLAKAYVVSVNPALLAEKGDRDTILHLCGRGVHAKNGIMAMRTIGAVETLKLVKHLHPSFPFFENDLPALSARNAALHMALTSSREMLQPAVIQMAKLTDSLLGLLELDREKYWGPHAVGVVDSLLDEAGKRLHQVVAAKVAAARKRMAEMTEGMAEEAAGALRTALAAGVHLSQFNEDGGWDHLENDECPACHYQQSELLCALGSEEVDWEHDGDGGTFEVDYGYPYLFFCPVCRLELNGDELAEAGISSQKIQLESEFEQDYEPDEDMLRGF